MSGSDEGRAFAIRWRCGWSDLFPPLPWCLFVGRPSAPSARRAPSPPPGQVTPDILTDVAGKIPRDVIDAVWAAIKSGSFQKVEVGRGVRRQAPVFVSCGAWAEGLAAFRVRGVGWVWRRVCPGPSCGASNAAR